MYSDAAYNVYILLHCSRKLHFRQAVGSSKDGVTYHDVTPLTSDLGESFCNLMPVFHTINGRDYGSWFLGNSKFTAFDKMSKQQNAKSLFTSLGTETIIFAKVDDFIIHVVYNDQNNKKQSQEVNILQPSKSKKERIHLLM